MPTKTARTRSVVARTVPARLIAKKLRFTTGTVARVEAFQHARGKKEADAWRDVVWAGLQALGVPAGAPAIAA